MKKNGNAVTGGLDIRFDDLGTSGKGSGEGREGILIDLNGEPSVSQNAREATGKERALLSLSQTSRTCHRMTVSLPDC